jgi:hypothetical protein
MTFTYHKETAKAPNWASISLESAGTPSDRSSVSQSRWLIASCINGFADQYLMQWVATLVFCFAYGLPLTSFRPRLLFQQRRHYGLIPPRQVAAASLNFCCERLVNELDGQRTLIAYYRLPNGIAAVVATGIVQGSDEDFVVPASHHQKRSLLISASDPDNSGRPVRFFIGNNPNDGDHSKGSFRHLIFSDHIVRKQSVKTG